MTPSSLARSGEPRDGGGTEFGRRPGRWGDPPSRPTSLPPAGRRRLLDDREVPVPDLAALTAMTRPERVQAIDAWLSGLLDEALASTPRQARRRSGPSEEAGGSGGALGAGGRPGA